MKTETATTYYKFIVTVGDEIDTSFGVTWVCQFEKLKRQNSYANRVSILDVQKSLLYIK